MKITRNNSLGFTVVEALLIIIVVAALVLVGWFVYNKNHQTKKTTTTTSSTTTKPKPEGDTSASAANFTIKEWGVQAPYTGSDRFAYTVSSDGKMITVISHTLSSQDSGCSTFGAGEIARLLPTDKTVADSTVTVADDAANYPAAYTHIGNYYYQFVHDQSACGNVSITAQDQANADVKALVAGLKSVN